MNKKTTKHRSRTTFPYMMLILGMLLGIFASQLFFISHNATMLRTNRELRLSVSQLTEERLYYQQLSENALYIGLQGAGLDSNQHGWCPNAQLHAFQLHVDYGQMAEEIVQAITLEEQQLCGYSSGLEQGY